MVDIPEVSTGRAAVGVTATRTADRLRGMIANLGMQLDAAKQAHVVRINTLATEYCEIQREYIEHLEAKVASLQQKVMELEARR